jgi:hypothetical protein
MKTNLWIGLLLFPFLWACEQKASFEGHWLGTAREMDKGRYIPFAKVLLADAEGRLRSYPLGESDTNWVAWKQEEGLLKIDTSTYQNGDFSLSDEYFVLNRAYKSYFVRLGKANHLDKGLVAKQLNNTQWESPYDKLYFKENGALLISTTASGKTEKACWELLEEQGHLFIIKRGSHLNCQGYIRFPEQVLSISEESFRVKRWEGEEWQEVEYKRKEELQLKADSFQLCNPYLYRNNSMHRYYYKGTFYKGGIYQLNKLLKAFYKAPAASKESGLIKVEFIVNCEGKVGAFSVLELDTNYQKKVFDERISAQLLAFTRTLNDWEVGRDKDGQPIDTYRFLFYKIKDGQVLEIFP